MEKNNNSENKSSNIVKFQKGFQVNVGIFLIIIFVLYVGFHVFSSLTKKEVYAYEVTLGTIVEKNHYQGMALRQEMVVGSAGDGNLCYFATNKSRVGNRTNVYAIDTTGEIISKINQAKENYRQLTSAELSGISQEVDSFVGGFDEVNYSGLYSFKDDVNEYLYDVLTRGLTNEYRADIDAAIVAGKFVQFPATTPGFLLYTIDGYEDKNLENFSPEDFNAGGMQVTNLRSREVISTGEPVYKLVTSDDWQLVIPIDESRVEELSAYDNIEIRFTQDGAKTWTSSNVMERDGSHYLVLSLDDSMERYADRRFINIDLLLDESAGLKIPNTAICNKTFFTIPKKYFFPGKNTVELGVMIRRDKDTFETPAIYYETEEYYYIDDEYVKEGDKLLMENSTNEYTVGSQKDTLKGAYNISKGYPVFKPVEVILDNEKYSVIKQKTKYGLSLYDHIALNADDIKGNEVLN